MCRFLHRSDHLNLDAPIAELLSAKEEDGETPKEIGMDVLFKGLPQTKKNKNLKKALTVKAANKGPDSIEKKCLRFCLKNGRDSIFIPCYSFFSNFSVL